MRRLAVLLVMSPLVCLAQTPTFWTPEVSMRVKGIGSVVPSNDGTLTAYEQSINVMEPERSETLTHIYLAKSDGSGRIQLTRGEKSCTSPSFSPDGQYVYFKSSRAGEGNLWRIAVRGGEAEQLTDWKGKIGSYEVSPDGKLVAFTAREKDPDEEAARKEKRDFRVVDEKPKNYGLWVIEAESAATQKRAPRAIVKTNYHIEGFAWSPDSRFLAFAHVPTPNADDWPKSDLSEVDVVSGAVRSLAATAAAESDPSYSRDGRHIAFERSSIPPTWQYDTRIVVLARDSGALRELPATFDQNPVLAGWSSDSKSLLVREPKGTRAALYWIPLDGPVKTLYVPERGTISSPRLNQAGTRIGVAMESSDAPPEAFFIALNGWKPVRVSAANVDLPKYPFGETAVVAWKSKDGMPVEGLLTYPVGFEKGRKYPLILNIHGGPAGVFGESFIGRPGAYPLATFAAKGYAILRPNPRGSSGYGKKFRVANLSDWGYGDYEDLMAGVDHVITMGVADPDRLAVMGWSYGGFMTSWVIGHTDRFKAAVVGAGVTDLLSFTGTTDIPGFLPDYFAGEPWKNPEAYRKHSPITYVGNVSTPTLVLHGEADERVPITQGYQFYSGLKRRGVATRMVVYPRTPHGVREPKFILDVMQRHLDWLERYIK